jgi:hypothetical protein
LRYGVARLPSGRRRKLLAEQLETRVLPTFAGRVLAFDLPVTQADADLMARAQPTGQPISMADGLIAAIAMTNRMIVVTRDAKPFAAVGLNVIDPWQLT